MNALDLYSVKKLFYRQNSWCWANVSPNVLHPIAIHQGTACFQMTQVIIIVLACKIVAFILWKINMLWVYNTILFFIKCQSFMIVVLNIWLISHKLYRHDQSGSSRKKFNTIFYNKSFTSGCITTLTHNWK
jgi:hypothetical protein